MLEKFKERHYQQDDFLQVSSLILELRKIGKIITLAAGSSLANHITRSRLPTKLTGLCQMLHNLRPNELKRGQILTITFTPCILMPSLVMTT